MKTLIGALTGAVLLAGCAAPGGDAYPVPPQLPQETRPLPPISDNALTWRPGDWVFSGGSYRYDPGRWVASAGHGNDWQFGHWTGPRGQYAWAPGRWLP